MKAIPSNSKLPDLLTAAASLGCLFIAVTSSADEQFFSQLRGTEVVPAGHGNIYQYITGREGKDSGSYLGLDYHSELEYGVTNRLNLSLAVFQHSLHVKNNAELGTFDLYRFGGIELGAKYNVLSAFKDPIGLAFRTEVAYSPYDDIGGISQEMIWVSPSILIQKNFLDDTLLFNLNAGVSWAWGKQPAEEYNKEIGFDGNFGASYRFASNWFIGLESRIRSEYPLFDLGFHEHTVVFVGPALHYGTQKWWVTLGYGRQVWGNGIDEPSGGTFAEEARNEFRLKIALNF